MSKTVKAIITAAMAVILCTFAPESPCDGIKAFPDITGDTLVFMIPDGKAYYGNDMAGFGMAVSENLEKSLHCHVLPAAPRDSLPHDRTGAADIVLDSSGTTVFFTGDNPGQFKAMTRWLARVTGNGEYEMAYQRFFHDYDSVSISRGRISPYDCIIKKHSSRVGWDWKLLAALIYCESKFLAHSESGKGAAGLMQIKPSTAHAYGTYDLYSPEDNIYAGTRHLRYLKNLFIKDGITDSSDLVRFTLAAYNAGEGRIEDCRAFAESIGKNPDKWDEVSEAIPLMDEKEHYEENENIKLGRFNGNETISYVRKVLSQYEKYTL